MTSTLSCNREPLQQDMIAIIDYGLGNVRSHKNIVNFCGEDAFITDDPAKIADAAGIILPGVGAFKKGMDRLRESGLTEILEREVRQKGKPFLGVCLGMQFLADASHEHGETPGLGWIPGQVRRFDFNDPDLRVPHMGWNDVAVKKQAAVFENLDAPSVFYFAHSYYFDAEDEKDVIASTEYGLEFSSAVMRDNVIGVQFHPEKSHTAGVNFMKNFVQLVKGAG